ncbi:MAG TPA: transglutaminase family protein [Burkholderiaceae bacterium]|nr:transglutaminase family protein [Burkholderiaceae bacterium]
MNRRVDAPASVRLRYSVDLGYQILQDGADFIFNIQAARTEQQLLVAEGLHISQPLATQSYEDASTHARYLRLRANAGPLHVHYEAIIDIAHHRAAPQSVPEIPIPFLPGEVLPYLYPSRYCESDRLHRFAVAQFGTLWQGYQRVAAIRDWVQAHVSFCSNTSDSTTSACDTLVTKQGVCRDFAHLMIALCRAVNIPARFASGIDYGADPALGPQDFHAYVEAYLGHRWYLFDPSGTAIPMGFIRLATGRDAADAAFASIFGSLESQAPVLFIEAVNGADGHCVVPVHGTDALSTDPGPYGLQRPAGT